jgi:hypothetical protein
MDAIAIAHKLALSYNRTTGIEVEELVSEAYLEYLIWEPHYKPEKSAKSTFAWMVMEGKMRDLAARAKNAPIADSEYVETCASMTGNPETRYLFLDSLRGTERRRLRSLPNGFRITANLHRRHTKGVPENTR